MNNLLGALKRDLGLLGLASILALGLAVVFSLAYVKPLEARKARLERGAESHLRGAPEEVVRVSARSASGQIDEFYRFFDRKERTDEWLAKLYGIGTAAGLQLRAGNYRLDDSRRHLDRYQVQLPVRGSYAQVRVFLEASLAEIPVMSVDQLTFRRKAANETVVDAEITLTLHLLRK